MHILPELLRSDALAPQSALRFGAQISNRGPRKTCFVGLSKLHYFSKISGQWNGAFS